jgi:diguanylate cyclase (GGDEF)-like protein
MAQQETVDSLAKDQSLRLQRMTWGFGAQFSTWLVILGFYLLGMLPRVPVAVYFLVILLIDLGFVILVKTHINLRFKDPSLTAAQILAPVWPALFIMFFVMDPQARTVFLLTATSGLMFGSFVLTRRGMLAVSAFSLTSYLMLLTALYLFAPERINWRIEIVIVFIYATVLLTVAYLGGLISSMRVTLKEKNRQLAELAARDPLTQLPNRRSLMDQLSQEIARVKRRSADEDALCVSMLDVDHFKRVNDTWGHDVGDAILCRISSELRKIMRQGDFLGRFGGEEFIVILPESTLDAARLTAQRIQDCVASLHFAELPDGECITVSQGLAIYQPGELIEATLKRADEALYLAKENGRNQVVVG